MEFRLLGPMEVAVRDRPVRLAGARQRKLLALLLLNADHPVPLSSLVDWVWDERPPATAKRQVQNLVSTLRRLVEGESAAGELGGPTIVAEGDGYRLRPGTATVDVLVFGSRVDKARELRLAGHIGPAAAELRAALGLWRGPALAGLTGQVVEAAAARLDEQRRTAAEDCVDLELQLGRHAELIGELTELVAVNPFRERLVEQLMLALYRSGRQSEALQAYRRLRDRLADELGLDPGTRLQRLHTDILNSEGHLDSERADGSVRRPAASAPGPRGLVPAQLPADVAAFVGRSAELKELDRLLSDHSAGAVTVSAISGTAGVGKTALALHWGHRSRRHFPDGQLYVNLRGYDPGGTAMDPADALRGFLDALGVPPERVPIDLHARSALYRSLLANRRVLVVLDNARDADQVRPLLPGSPSCPVVVTSRSLLTGLVAAEGARPVVLSLLDPADARQLLGARIGQDRLEAEPRAADEIVQRCALLPLALAVAAARAVTHPGFPLATIARELSAARGTLDPFTGGDPATDVRAVFSWSYRQLSASAKGQFRILGLHPGPDFTVPAAASLAGVGEQEARAGLAELTAANLIQEHAPGRYAFHDLLRAYAAELAGSGEPDGERSAALHRLLDHYLHSAYAADRMLDRFRDPISSMPPRDGVVTVDITDHEHAMDWFTAELPGLLAAVDLAARTGFDAYAWRLAWAMAYFLERRGHWLPWVAAQRTALAAAQRLGDRAGQAQAYRSLGRVHVHLGQPEQAVALLGRAQELFRDTGDLAGEGRVHFDLSWIASRQGDNEGVLDHAQQALVLFQTAGNRSGQARAFNTVAWGHYNLGHHRESLAAGERALALTREIGDTYGEADTWDTLGYAHLALRRDQEAIRCYLRAEALYRDLGHRWAEAQVLTRLGDAHHALGDARAASGAWRRAVTILDELGHPDADLVRAKLR